MMRMAELWGYRPHNSNPCKNTRRYKVKPVERFLTAEEMARLNAVLTRDEFWCPHIVAIVRLLMLTGCRFGEIASLEWDWIKDRRIHLPDSKSGPRTVWLSSAARAVIDAIPRYGPDCPYLFPARPPTPPTGYRTASMRPWPEGRKAAGRRPAPCVRPRPVPRPSPGDPSAMSTFDLTPRLARESRSNGKDTILFDKAVTGFGLRIHPSGRKVWIVQARIEGRSRRIVIARHGEIELAEARRRARDMLARIRAGDNPADDIQREKETPTLRAFADEDLRRSEPHWKPSGRRTVRIYLKARILPAFGRMPLDRIGAHDVAAWFDAASRDKPGAANRAFEILRAMMNRAEDWGLRERGSNPCLGIAKNPRNNVARFLDTDELARLGRALDAREDRWPEAVAAIRLLALTGCRRSEVLALRWRDIGEDAIALEDSKTGPRAVPLGEAARALIEGLPGARKANAFLFPRHAEGRGEWSLTTCWRTVCAEAGLGRLRLHDLRHTAASQAVMAGENLPLVGKLLGHRRHRTTAGYAHLDDAHLVEAAERVGRLRWSWSRNVRRCTPRMKPNDSTCAGRSASGKATTSRSSRS